MKKTNKKGFTLAELLIVVAIIAVLVAIAIPIFSAQLEKSKEATDLANVRAAYAEIVAKYIEDGSAHSATITLKSNGTDNKTGAGDVAGVSNSDILEHGTSVEVKVDADGKVTIAGKDAKSSFIGS